MKKIIIIAAFALFLISCSSQYDSFAQCLSDKDVKFYGAFWCPHCAHQKELFEHSENLPYTECSLPDQSGQTEVCIAANITGYPTWEFSNSERISGVMTVQQLSQKTGCALP